MATLFAAVQLKSAAVSALVFIDDAVALALGVHKAIKIIGRANEFMRSSASVGIFFGTVKHENATNTTECGRLTSGRCESASFTPA